MMILLFIHRHLLLIIFFVVTGFSFSPNVFSEKQKKFDLPDKSGSIFWKCNKDLCNVFLKKKNAASEVILKNSSFPLVNALNKNLIELFFSCGSPCNYTFFYSTKNGISKAFEFVIAVNTKKEIVIVAEKNSLVGYRIFSNKKLFNIKRDWSPTAVLFSAILNAKFVDDSLYIKYLKAPIQK